MSWRVIQLKSVRSWVNVATRWISRTYEGRPSNPPLTEAKSRRRRFLAQTLFNVFASSILALFLVLPYPTFHPWPSLRLGELAEKNLISPFNLLVDTPVLRRQEEQAAKNVPPVYDYDDQTIHQWAKRWQMAIREIRQQLYRGAAPPNYNPKLVSTINQILEEKISARLGEHYIKLLHEVRFSLAIENAIGQAAESLSGRLVSHEDLLPKHYTTGILVRQINYDLREILLQDLSRIWSLEQTLDFLSNRPSHLRAGSRRQPAWFDKLVTEILPPNLTYNASLTQKRVQRSLKATQDNQLKFKSGQTIIKLGERITEHHVTIKQEIEKQLSPSVYLTRFGLHVVVLLLFMTVLFRLTFYGKGFWQLTFKDSLFFIFITTLTFALFRSTAPYASQFFAAFEVYQNTEFFFPIITGSIIVQLMLGKTASFNYALIVSLLIGHWLDSDYVYTFWALTVMASSIQTIGAGKRRTDLYKCGFWSGLLAATLLGALEILAGLGLDHFSWGQLAMKSSLAFFSSFLSSVIATTLIPLLESLWSYTTSLKLLELANFNHPLLHSLMMKAPGTYHHSVIVGSLAEIAAEQIKANGLLARVSAYYHDIGKMNKPMYFIENQSPNQNPHDQLQPVMSARILVAHVKSGVKLAMDYKLGKLITDIIEQHHGTTLISYFFNKAKSAEDPNTDVVTEEQYRYPGPKPQTREAAIVMLADACEAATRSIGDPTASRIQAMVRSIINKRFLEGQFHECDLTGHELQVIEEHFVRTLVSLYHNRIQYPGQNAMLDKNEAEQRGAS